MLRVLQTAFSVAFRGRFTFGALLTFIVMTSQKNSRLLCQLADCESATLFAQNLARSVNHSVEPHGASV